VFISSVLGVIFGLVDFGLVATTAHFNRHEHC